MTTLRINGVNVEAEETWTIIEACNFYGIDIPTLCYLEGLTPWGGCRLCVVEITNGKKTKLVTACTYPVTEGLKVRTHSKKVIQARKIVIELLLARCPSSKTVQDLASKYGVQKVRFELKHDNCILCGLCIRMCKEQMGSGAIDFINRGQDLKITTPFDIKSEICRTCGGCIYVCPACQSRCEGPDATEAVCGRCLNIQPSCLEHYDDAQCFMSETGCGTCVKEPKKKANLKEV